MMRRDGGKPAAASDWPGRPGRRLAASMGLATLLLATIFWTARAPDFAPTADPVELVVQVVRPAAGPSPPDTDIEPESDATAPPAETPPVAPRIVEPQKDPAGAGDAEVPSPPVDWRALGEDVARAVVEDGRGTRTVNPGFEEKRAAAAEQFRPSEAPEKRFIWDNVEKDYLGRTILVAGDCYRVLDDPSAVYRDIFETFTQYFVFCAGGGSSGVELPWVAEVRDRHTYLQRRIDDRERIPLD